MGAVTRPASSRLEAVKYMLGGLVFSGAIMVPELEQYLDRLIDFDMEHTSMPFWVSNTGDSASEAGIVRRRPRARVSKL